MADTSVFLLLHEIFVDAVGLIQVSVYVHLAHIVEKVEIKILCLALLQLLLKDFLHLVHVGEVVAREFISQVKALPWVFGENAAHHQLGGAVVVSPGSIVIVYTVVNSILHHIGCGGLVYLRVIAVNDRQAHAAHAQGRQL